MADRTTRSASLRSNSRNPSSQNLPPISSFRVTRGKSREISDSDVRGRGPKRIKKNAGLASARSEDRVNSNVGKRAPRSTLLQDAPTVTKDLVVINEQSPQDEARTSDLGGAENELPKIKSPGAASAISGTTARNSNSAHDLAQLSSREDLRKETMKKATTARPLVDQNAKKPSWVISHEDVPSARLGTARDSRQSKGSISKSARPSLLRIISNSPRSYKAAALHLTHLMAEERNKKLLPQEQKLQQEEGGEEEEEEEEEGDVITEVPALGVVSLAKPTISKEFRETGTQYSPPQRSQGAVDSDHEGDAWRNQDFPDDDDDNILATAERNTVQDLVARGRQVLALQASRDAESNKENFPGSGDRREKRSKGRFIDRQPNAHRIPSISQDITQAVSEEDQQPLPGEFVVTEGEEAEETEGISADEGFQQDQRTFDRQPRPDRSRVRKRPASTARKNRRSEKRVRAIPVDDDSSDEIQTAVTRHNREQAPTPSQLNNFNEAKKIARFKTARLRQPQTRKFWTDQETETLIDLIEEHGISWALLKQQDTQGVLEFRDQVALKDKARNIKLDFLKAGTHMPQNFENIALSKLQTEKLRSLGIEYDDGR